MAIAPLPVLLVDDDPDMLARLGEVLGSVGVAREQLCEAGSLAECQQLVTAPEGGLQPMVMALIDLGLPDGNGIDLIGWLRARNPQLPILVVSAWSTEEMILGALRAGANGYVLKERDDLEIALSVRNVLKGGAPIDPFIARRILDLVGRPAGRPATPSQPPDPALREALRETHAASVRQDRGWELRRSLELLGYAAAFRPALLDRVYGAPLRRSLARGDWVTAAGDDFGSHIPQHSLGAWRQRVGLRALARLDAHWAQAQQQAQQRIAQLRTLPGLEVVEDSPPQAQGIWPVILLRMSSAAQRDALMQAHWASGWGLSLPFSRVLPDYERYAPVLGEAMDDPVPQARDWAQRLLAISNSAWLSDALFGQLLDALRQTMPPSAAG